MYSSITSVSRQLLQQQHHQQHQQHQQQLGNFNANSMQGQGMHTSLNPSLSSSVDAAALANMRPLASIQAYLYIWATMYLCVFHAEAD